MTEQITEIPEKPIQPEIVPEIPAQLPKESNLPKIVLLVVLGLLAAGGLVYAGTRIGKKQITPSKIIAEPALKPASPTPNPTADWKTYTDDQGGWQLMYPDTYFKYQGDPKLGFLVSTSAPEGGVSPKFFGVNDVWLGGGRINTNLKSLDQYLTSRTDYTNLQKISATIGGISGIKLAYTTMVGPAEPFTPQYVNEGLVLKDKNIYFISITSWSKEALDNNQNLFDQILSTFKFLD